MESKMDGITVEINRDKTGLDMYRISNCYNWLYGTYGIRFLE